MMKAALSSTSTGPFFKFEPTTAPAGGANAETIVRSSMQVSARPHTSEIVDAAERSVGDHLLCSLHGGAEAPVERRLMPDASLFDSVVHLLRFARVHRERLFAANVLAGRRH